PSISGQWVLFTRYVHTTRTTKVLLYNTHSHELRTLATDRGRNRFVYSGQVNGDYAVWGSVRSSGQEVYRYQISTNANTLVPRATLWQYNPSVARDGAVYYTRSEDACGAGVSLVRYLPESGATDLHDF